MNTKKIVVLADIESVRVPFTSFEKALKEVSKYGDVAGCKFYGYSAKRTKDYADFIADNNYDALSSLAGKRKGKLDLRHRRHPHCGKPQNRRYLPSVRQRKH